MPYYIDSILCFIPAVTSTIIIGGMDSSYSEVAAVLYFGPLNITIPSLSVAVDSNTAVYINGTLYSCGGSTGACYKYDLAENSGTWEMFTTISGWAKLMPAVAFDDFFWYFNEKIREVPVNGNSVTSYEWGLGYHGCAVGNGSHSLVIQYLNSSVLMNSDPSFPNNWNTVVELNEAVHQCGCMWFGNTIYVTGGVNATSQAINTVQLINTDTFELTLGAPLPITIFEHKMGVIDGKPAVIGGVNTFGILSSIYVYDSSNNTWSLSSHSLSGGRKDFGSVTF